VSVYKRSIRYIEYVSLYTRAKKYRLHKRFIRSKLIDEEIIIEPPEVPAELQSILHNDQFYICSPDESRLYKHPLPLFDYLLHRSEVLCSKPTRFKVDEMLPNQTRGDCFKPYSALTSNRISSGEHM
jgi:hypothetical protein